MSLAHWRKRASGIADVRALAYTPDGVLSESFSRDASPAFANSGLFVSGQEIVTLIPVWEGMIVGRIMFHCWTTGNATTTNTFYTIRDKAGVLLRQTPSAGTEAWVSSAPKMLTLTAPYEFTYTGWARVGAMWAGTGTAPTLGGRSVANAANGGGTGGSTHFLPFIVGRDSTNTGLTTTAPSTSAAVSGGLTNQPYAQLLPPAA